MLSTTLSLAPVFTPHQCPALPHVTQRCAIVHLGCVVFGATEDAALDKTRGPRVQKRLLEAQDVVVGVEAMNRRVLAPLRVPPDPHIDPLRSRDRFQRILVQSACLATCWLSGYLLAVWLLAGCLATCWLLAAANKAPDRWPSAGLRSGEMLSIETIAPDCCCFFCAASFQGPQLGWQSIGFELEMALRKTMYRHGATAMVDGDWGEGATAMVDGDCGGRW